VSNFEAMFTPSWDAHTSNELFNFVGDFELLTQKKKWCQLVLIGYL
jgi:hypothetical protein